MKEASAVKASTESRQDLAPALSRGMELLMLLARDGQSSLEVLAHKTKWPKSSLWRYLRALESMRAVRQDPDSRHWEALMILQPVEHATSPTIVQARRHLPEWAGETRCCAELYRVEKNRLILVDRAEPEDDVVSLRARIGFERDLSELDATALVYFAFQSEATVTRDIWVWHEGRRQKLGSRAACMRIEAVRELGWARDHDYNDSGYRRFARPIMDGTQLVGVMAIAQRQTPIADREISSILHFLKQTR